MLRNKIYRILNRIQKQDWSYDQMIRHIHYPPFLLGVKNAQETEIRTLGTNIHHRSIDRYIVIITDVRINHVSYRYLTKMPPDLKLIIVPVDKILDYDRAWHTIGVHLILHHKLSVQQREMLHQIATLISELEILVLDLQPELYDDLTPLMPIFALWIRNPILDYVALELNHHDQTHDLLEQISHEIMYTSHIRHLRILNADITTKPKTTWFGDLMTYNQSLRSFTWYGNHDNDTWLTGQFLAIADHPSLTKLDVTTKLHDHDIQALSYVLRHNKCLQKLRLDTMNRLNYHGDFLQALMWNQHLTHLDFCYDNRSQTDDILQVNLDNMLQHNFSLQYLRIGVIELNMATFRMIGYHPTLRKVHILALKFELKYVHQWQNLMFNLTPKLQNLRLNYYGMLDYHLVPEKREMAPLHMLCADKIADSDRLWNRVYSQRESLPEGIVWLVSRFRCFRFMGSSYASP